MKIHKLYLNSLPFRNIKDNTKKYEIRLNSTTRKIIKVGDVLNLIWNNLHIYRRVKRKYVFNDLDECFNTIDFNLAVPNLKHKTKSHAIKHYNKIFSDDRIKKHKIVVFEINY